MSEQAPILVFDSGLGGLTVHREIIKALPDTPTHYIADDAAFPYGRLTPENVITRVLEVLGAAVAQIRPSLVVMACNTASTVALPALRACLSVPVVGTVPAIKPAAASSRSKVIAVLGTPGTVSREYTHDLIIKHAADCRVQLVGAASLAQYAEAALRGQPVDPGRILAEIAPCFVEKEGARTDAIVLACTHYPLLVDTYRAVAPWPVLYVDPAPAIARRVVEVLAERRNPPAPEGGGVDIGQRIAPLRTAVFTSGALPDPALTEALWREGLTVAL